MPAPEEAAKPLRQSGAQEDLRLAEACRNGELAAYEKLYEIHGGRLKSLAYNLLGNAADAEDAVQEVFLRVCRGIGSFRGQSSFSTWMYRILLNWCQDAWRRRRNRPEPPPPSPSREAAPPRDVPAPAGDHPLRMALETCVARLKPRHREVFLMYEVEGFTHAEIAATLRISEGASKNILYEAKQNLRRMLSRQRKPV